MSEAVFLGSKFRCKDQRGMEKVWREREGNIVLRSFYFGRLWFFKVGKNQISSIPFLILPQLNVTFFSYPSFPIFHFFKKNYYEVHLRWLLSTNCFALDLAKLWSSWKDMEFQDYCRMVYWTQLITLQPSSWSGEYLKITFPFSGKLLTFGSLLSIYRIICNGFQGANRD